MDSALNESGSPLPEAQRKPLERSLGHDLSGVRIHTGHAAEQAADAIHAKAFTVGNDIVFGEGKYRPGTKEGDHLLAHEMAHVAQGASETIQREPKDRAVELLVKANPVSAFLKLASPMQAVIAGAMAGYVDAESMGALHKILYDDAMKRTSSPRLYSAAFAAGALATAGTSLLEVIGGIGGEAVGLTLDASGVGAVAGVPLNLASAALIVHGYITVVAGITVSLDALQHMSMMEGKAPHQEGSGEANNGESSPKEPQAKGLPQKLTGGFSSEQLYNEAISKYKNEGLTKAGRALSNASGDSRRDKTVF